jgi:hypothetical protein
MVVLNLIPGNIKEIMLDVEGFAFASSNSSFPFVPLCTLPPPQGQERKRNTGLMRFFPVRPHTYLDQQRYVQLGYRTHEQR